MYVLRPLSVINIKPVELITVPAQKHASVQVIAVSFAAAIVTALVVHYAPQTELLRRLVI